MNRRAWAASRRARKRRTSSAGASRPSANAATFVGRRTVAGRSSSGSPTSVAPKTSRESVPAAWPTCMPNTAEPRRRMSAAGSPAGSPSAPAGRPGRVNPTPGRAEVSSAMPSGSWSRRTVASASATDAATGATSSFHAGSVCSTHSDRLHAWLFPPDGGRSVTASSQSSATDSASVTARCCAGEIDGSPSATATWRATSCETSVLTGPSLGVESMRCT
ncbi:Uncharacterised protein [Mycobacteroides abscessus]|nr:Uncharacterised protein [Mycobacteroides abscessus]